MSLDRSLANTNRYRFMYVYCLIVSCSLAELHCRSNGSCWEINIPRGSRKAAAEAIHNLSRRPARSLSAALPASSTPVSQPFSTNRRAAATERAFFSHTHTHIHMICLIHSCGTYPNANLALVVSANTHTLSHTAVRARLMLKQNNHDIYSRVCSTVIYPLRTF